VVLSWKTQNAESVRISGVGEVSPVNGGSVTVNPTGNTTYTATVTDEEGRTHTGDCTVRIVIDDEPPPSGPRCVYLRASDESIEEGQEITLTWETERAERVELNQGIGRVAEDGSREVSPDNDTTYVLTVYDDEDGDAQDAVDTCEVTVRVDDDDDDDGGGGGGSRKPRVVLGVETVEPEPPLSYVYLSEMPYTGLDLGPIGTAVYWLMLIGWSAAAAYLLIFNVMPFAFRRVNTFGSDVHGVLNKDSHAEAPMAQHVAESSHAQHAAAAAPQDFRGYTSNEGFRSFAQAESLTIDDIVKGLSRETGHAEPAYMAHTEPVIVPGTERIQPEMPREAPVMEVHHDIPAFLEALLSGDRDQVFGMLRNVNRTGGDSETFVTHAVCALDDAYRARLDGTPCHPEVMRATEGVAMPFLERIISSLATAVDSSYSTGVTGAKLALTRALAVVNG